MKEKVQNVLAYLGHDLIERDEPLKLALLSILAGENSVLLGPPGTGKSLMARRIADMIEHPDGKGGYFEYLLTKFSTPDEIFGPLSIAELKSDRFRRNTEKYLPTASIGFLDEIFKSNSSILNSLLTILNERIYHNGAEAQKVPLRALIAASNEVPNEHDELTALYDRFLLRCFVDYVSDTGFEGLFDEPQPQERPASITENEMDSILNGSGKVALPEEVISAISQIWRAHKDAFKEDRRESLSDRRLKKAVKLIKVSAHTNGRNEADLSDVLLLKNCLWNHPENAAKVQDIVLNALKEFSRLIEVDDKGIQETLEPKEASYNPSKVAEKGKMHAVVKGFLGQGTVDDPIILETIEDLTGLTRPEVGMQGYHFKQVKDIDCSMIENWPEIDFIGHYDGNQRFIKTNAKDLFNRILGNSTISRLKLETTCLATTIEDSKVCFCTVHSSYVCVSAKNTEFEGIVTEGSIAYHGNGFSVFSTQNLFVNCIIRRCRSSNTMIDKGEHCTFVDSLMVGADRSSIWPSLQHGGIANSLTENSSIERCLSSGSIKYYSDSAGILGDGVGGIIRDCILGPGENSPERRIVYRANGGIKLVNNAAISSHLPGNSNAATSEGSDGRSVDPKLFNQRFFEFTLNWDFENTWYWDDKENRPELRNVGFDGIDTPSAETGEEQSDTKIDLLTKQIKENIWL